jgi:predicted  nucleic acid-binding Zn-ribbon protein
MTYPTPSPEQLAIATVYLVLEMREAKNHAATLASDLTLMTAKFNEAERRLSDLNATFNDERYSYKLDLEQVYRERNQARRAVDQADETIARLQNYIKEHGIDLPF